MQNDLIIQLPVSMEEELTDIHYWRCEHCNFVLGTLPPDNNVINLKYKDFYASIKCGSGGSVSVLCRRCGTLNTINDKV